MVSKRQTMINLFIQTHVSKIQSHSFAVLQFIVIAMHSQKNLFGMCLKK